MEQKLKKRGRGRPPADLVREHMVSFHLTKHDAGYLAEFASDYGFKGRSEVITYIIERLITGGFSGISGMKACMVLQEHCRKKNPSKYHQGSFAWDELRPSPRIDDDLLTKDQRILLCDIAERLQRKGLA